MTTAHLGPAASQAGPTMLELRIDSARSLSEALVAEVAELCDRIEDAAVPVVAVAEIVGCDAAAPSAWPGAGIGVHTVSRWERALRRLERSRAILVATATGHCQGPALEVLLVADYRIVTSNLRIRVPVGPAGVWPGMAVHRLARQIGAARSRRLVLFGAEIDAREGVRTGLFDEAVDEVADLSGAVGFTAELCAEHTDGLAVRRALLLDAGAVSFEDALGVHLAACDRTMRCAE